MSGWTWEYDGYLPTDERLRESLCTLGNGYFATRGALPECAADDVHYPGTYVAGIYNRLTSDVSGRQVLAAYLIVLAVSLISTLYPALIATRVAPVEAMGSEE